MPRRPRKFLAMPICPSKRILFSFNTSKGDNELWQSSDSDDSDYEPLQLVQQQHLKGHQSNYSKVREKKSGGKEKLKIASCTETKLKEPECLHDWVLPFEIWLNVFDHVVALEGLPFLFRAARVCKLWYKLSCHPSLWFHVDLTYWWTKVTDANLKQLSESRLLSCRELNVSRCKHLTNTGIEYIAEHCKKLRSINLSYTSNKVTAECISTLANNCPKLAKVDVSYSSMVQSTNGKCLDMLLSKCKSRLTHLNISGSYVARQMTKIINTKLTQCTNLTYLNISDSFPSHNHFAINIEELQRGCPNLKVLHLDVFSLSVTNSSKQELESGPGFPLLEEFTLSSEHKAVRVMFVNSVINRFLKTSSKLKLLDLRGCFYLQYCRLLKIPATDIEDLRLTYVEISGIQEEKEALLNRWQHSLLHLDLSWTQVDTDLNELLRNFFRGYEDSRLRTLNLTGTAVDVDIIREIILVCPQLEHLDLSSCRRLLRGMKRVHIKDDIKKLMSRKDVMGLNWLM